MMKQLTHFPPDQQIYSSVIITPPLERCLFLLPLNNQYTSLHTTTEHGSSHLTKTPTYIITTDSQTPNHFHPLIAMTISGKVASSAPDDDQVFSSNIIFDI